MDNQEVAIKLVRLAKALVAEESTTARKAEDADTAPSAEEEERFSKKVVGIKPAVLKTLARLKNKKVNKYTDVSLQMTVEDLIDALNAVISAAGGGGK
jgi:hypothetical protein